MVDAFSAPLWKGFAQQKDFPKEKTEPLAGPEMRIGKRNLRPKIMKNQFAGYSHFIKKCYNGDGRYNLPSFFNDDNRKE